MNMDSNKLHILQVISGLDIGGGHGGAERFGVELSRRLDKHHIDVQLCAFWKRNTEVETYWLNVLKSEGIPVFFAAEWQGKFHLEAYRKGVKELVERCKDFKADWIHSHFQMGTIAALYAKHKNTSQRVMRTAHITREWGEGIIAWILRQIFTSWIFPLLVDIEVGVSQAVLDRLLNNPGKRWSKMPPQLIHNGIYLEEFQTTPKLYSWDILIDEDDLVIGSVGRLTHQKGYEFLIKAAPEVINSYPKASFILIGEGDLRPQLEDLAAQLGVQERFRFIGKVEDVKPYLQRMDVFVLPSLWEGFPTVIMESMASGVPVIATDIPGTRELIQDGIDGWLVPPMDAGALSKTIMKTLSAPEEREVRAREAKIRVQDYSFDRIAKQYEDTYHRFLSID